MKRLSDKEVITQAIKQMPRLEKLSDRLNNRPEEVLDRLEPSPAGAPFGERLERDGGARPRRDPEETRREREHVLDAGQRGLSKVRADGARASLARLERVGLEAIILLAGRPAILIQNGTFAQPTEDEWQVLEQQRPQIERSIKSVGRIEVDGHPSFEWIGTGFLVADDVVMTNRHVANEFARMKSATRWSFAPGITVRIDYVEELGSSNQAEFKVTGIIGLHQDVDMALLRVAKKSGSGAARPQPLPLAKTPTLTIGRRVYVVGYPASDSRRNDPVEMRRIFANIYDVKRLQPGAIKSVQAAARQLTHDCSTLGGNSGSCVIDLESHQVVGLHFGGRYLENNFAVILSRLKTDALIKKAALSFS